MRKLKSLLISFIIICLCVLPLTILSFGAESFPSVTGEDCSKNGGTAQYNYDSTTKTLTIYGTGEFTSAPLDKYFREDAVKNLIIGEGITKIGFASFKNSEAVEYISVPSTVTDIGEDAFKGYCNKIADRNDEAIYIGDCLICWINQTDERHIKPGTRLIASNAFVSPLTFVGDKEKTEQQIFSDLYIPKSVTAISSTALSIPGFENDEGIYTQAYIKNIYYEGSQEDWNNISANRSTKSAFTKIMKNVNLVTDYSDCTHENKELVSSTPSTCLTQGSVTYRCVDCGMEFTEDLPLAQHSFDNDNINEVIKSTCTEKGTGKVTCTVCGKEKNVELELAPHTEEIIKGYDATCTKQGKSDGTKCSVCGKIIKEQEDIPMVAHEFGDWEITKEATCNSQGERKAKCSNCSATKTETIEKDKTNHKNVALIGYKEPTCEEVGNKGARFCNDCLAILDGTLTGKEIPALGHDEEILLSVTPTCTSFGYTQGIKCKRCEKILDGHTRLDKLPHSFTSWTLSDGYSCDIGGSRKRECTVCGEKQEETLLPGEHSYGEWEILTDSTCMAVGQKTHFCTVCQASETVEIERKPHKLGEWYCIKNSSCKTPGTEKRVCLNDDCTYLETRDMALNPDNHFKTELVKKRESTCIDTGYSGDIVCVECGEVRFRGSVISKSSHTYGEEIVEVVADCMTEGRSYRECTVCGEKKYKTLTGKNNHIGQFIVINKIEPTCVSKGNTGDTICDKCKAVIVPGTPIDETNHLMGVWKVDIMPTCISEGLERRHCENAGCTYTENREMKIDKTRHCGATHLENALTPTCTSKGYTGNTVCDNCKQIISKGIDIAAEEHSFGSWSVVKSATCVEFGEKTRSCSVCGKTETDTIAIDKSNHCGATHLENVTAPTCTSKGYTGNTVCDNCKQIISKGIDIAAEEHSFGSWSVVKSATCVEFGEKTRSCSVCGKTETDTVNIDSNNHIGNTEIRNEIKATCTSQGSTGDTYCIACGHKIATGKTVSKLSHSMGSWYTAKAASYTTEGISRRSCKNCSYTEDKVIEKKSFMMGDLNNDGKLTASDARIALRISAKIQKADERILAAGDINNDGKITALDARNILRVVAKLQAFTEDKKRQ